MAEAAIAEDFLDAALAVPDDDDRMGDQQRLAGALGDLAEHRIEQERHVVVDDGDDRHRPALADDAGIDVYGDDAIALAVLGDSAPGEVGGALEIGGVVGGDILGRRAGEQIVGEPARPFARLCRDSPGSSFSAGLRISALAMMLIPSRHMLLRLW